MALRADRIRERRLALRLSQEKLAELTGVNQTQVSRWEMGTNDVSGETLTGLARALQTTSDYLLGLTDERLGHLRAADGLDDLAAEVVTILGSTDDSRRQAILLLARTIATLD